MAEITFRTEAARAVIETIARNRPDMLVGAGTVITLDQLEAAKAAGAQYALSPGIDSGILDRAAEIGLPFAPGLMTPSELQLALRHGCQVVKFFPAGAAGGPKMLQSMAAPYAHTGIGFNPTGGVSLDTLADWIAIPAGQNGRRHLDRDARGYRQKGLARHCPPRPVPPSTWWPRCGAGNEPETPPNVRPSISSASPPPVRRS